MNPFVQGAILAASSLRLIPHLLLYRLHSGLVDDDLLQVQDRKRGVRNFVKAMTRERTFRNLFYYRIGEYKAAPANPNIQIKGGSVSLFGHEQVAALNDAKVAAQETNKKLDRLIQQVEYISGQLGPWPQLGQNSKGENLTLVDGVAAARRDIANIQQQIQIILKGK